MKDIDIQIEEIKENYPYPWDGFTEPTIKKTPSEVEGLDDIEIEYNKYYHGQCCLEYSLDDFNSFDFCGDCDILHNEI